MKEKERLLIPRFSLFFFYVGKLDQNILENSWLIFWKSDSWISKENVKKLCFAEYSKKNLKRTTTLWVSLDAELVGLQANIF